VVGRIDVWVTIAGDDALTRIEWDVLVLPDGRVADLDLALDRFAAGARAEPQLNASIGIAIS
jgi:hypothetical protein